MKKADRIAYQLTVTDREILPDDPNIFRVISKQFRQSFSGFTRQRRVPVPLRKKMRKHFQLHNIIGGIEPTLNKTVSAVNRVSNALGKGDFI